MVKRLGTDINMVIINKYDIPIQKLLSINMVIIFFFQEALERSFCLQTFEPMVAMKGRLAGYYHQSDWDLRFHFPLVFPETNQMMKR